MNMLTGKGATEKKHSMIRKKVVNVTTCMMRQK